MFLFSCADHRPRPALRTHTRARDGSETSETHGYVTVVRTSEGRNGTRTGSFTSPGLNQHLQTDVQNRKTQNTEEGRV